MLKCVMGNKSASEINRLKIDIFLKEESRNGINNPSRDFMGHPIHFPFYNIVGGSSQYREKSLFLNFQDQFLQ